MKFLCFLAAGAAISFAAVSSDAASVRYGDGGLAVGIDELDVNGLTWYVTFKNGSYDSVFSEGLPAFLNNEPLANLAADAIRDVLNAEPAVPQIGTVSPSEILWVPTDLIAPNRFAAEQVGHNSPLLPWQRYPDFQGQRGIDYSTQPTPYDWLFATFSRTPPPVVPVPASLPLMLAGFGVFAVWRRRQS